jgi:hypothetical protein
MPRKGPAPRRELVADPIHKSVLVTQITNKVMLHGKRTVAEKIVYGAISTISEKATMVTSVPGRSILARPMGRRNSGSVGTSNERP